MMRLGSSVGASTLRASSNEPTVVYEVTDNVGLGGVADCGDNEAAGLENTDGHLGMAGQSSPWRGGDL